MIPHSQDKHIERPTSTPWPPIFLFALPVASWLLGRTWPLPWPGTDDVSAQVIGLGMGVAGVLLLVWAVLTFQRHKTNILPHRGADALITDGPFRYRRNPIYLADVMIFMGLAEISKNIWFALAGLVFGVLVTGLAIIPEERHLEAKFGDAYRDYKSKTRRWI